MADIIVGRNPGDSGPRIRIEGDTTVSSTHCWLSSLGGGKYRLEDKSKNGTFVRERGGWRRLAAAAILSADDEIMLGRYTTTIGQLLAKAVDLDVKPKLKRNPITAAIVRQ